MPSQTRPSKIIKRGVSDSWTAAARAAGGWVHGETGRNQDPMHPVSSRRGARRRGANRHLKACLLTAALAALWSPLVHRPDLNRQTLVLLRVIAHATYMLECALSSTRKYLSNRFSPSEWSEYVQQLAHAAPQLVWRIECYHYRRVRRQGRSTAARQKVVTNVASEAFEVGNWNDVTAWSTVDRALPFGWTDTHPGTAAATFLRITLTNLFVFARPTTGERYLSQEARFQEREGRRDRYCRLTRHMGLPHFRPKALVARTGLSDVAFASRSWFWLASVAGLTVPYRIWFSRHCWPAAVTVTKEIDR